VCDLEIIEGVAPSRAPETDEPLAVSDTLPQSSTVGEADASGAAPQPETGEAEAAQSAASPAENVVMIGEPEPAPKTQKLAAVQPQATVRVGLDKIDRLMNLVGELVINQAMLSQSVSEAGIPQNSDVSQGLDEFMQLTRDIQDSVMTIRAQPVKSLFQRMSRIVREASAELGKNVRLRTEGENTEVDKTVIERLADPLTHMIRNAVDHGLESNERRAMVGKTPEGNVTLSAAHQSGRVVIEVSDDGAGINRERVREKAIENGLISEDAILSDTEIDNLLFMPGFSTAGEISALSGRGVGMDVVKTAIQSLGGRVTISSKAGKGTKFSISLPLTLAVLDGMVVQVAGETLVMPLGSIIETLTLTKDNLRRLDREGMVVEIRGGYAPLIDLGVSLGYRESLENYEGTIVLVIGFEDGSRSTIVVDDIQDQRQVVIKGLKSVFSNPPGVAAATILGDGQIALILDPIELTRGRTTVSAAA
jgi:two-component system chemotaxis sensor kinase CheA